MKTAVAYALLVIGLPQMIGMACGSFIVPIVAKPVRYLLRHASTRVVFAAVQYLEIINAMVASLAGALLFRLFGLTAGFAVPVVMTAWVMFYFLAYRQPKDTWIVWLVGIFGTWFSLSKMFIGG